MRYKLETIHTGDIDLTDEIACVRHTIADLIAVLSSSEGAGRLAAGSMVREAIEQLSRLVERQSRLPPSPTAVDASLVNQVLSEIGSAVKSLPASPVKDTIIMTIENHKVGISNTTTDAHTSVLRTCELMDGSVPKPLLIPEDHDESSPEIKQS